MNKKILSIFSLITLLSLGGCNKNNTSSIYSSSNSSSETIDFNDGKYRVKVLLPNGESAGAGIQVQWCAGGTCKDAVTDSNGIATYELEDGTYDVKLYQYPSEYSYQLGQVATAENKTLEIKLQTILTAQPKVEEVEGDDSTKAGSAYNPYIVHEGVYKTTINETDEIVYYGFVPTRPGKYIIESWGTASNLITADPYVGYYGSNPQYVNELLDSDNDSGYDVNFALEFNIAIEEFVNTGLVDNDGNMIYEKDENGNYVAGGIYTFGISATPVKSPKTFPFVIKWVEDYVVERKVAEVIEVEETLSLYPEKPAEYVWIDSKINGLDTAVYNENDGFYHVGSIDGYILTAKISEPCLYMDRAFSKYNEETGENDGIVSVTGIVLDNGSKDYTNFVQEYEKYCNSDGVYGVTEELKTFLSYYYQHSKEWIISLSETVVSDECGWMFACGYYADKADSYAKPWSGEGTSDSPYLLLVDEYYAKIPEGESVFYSYSLKNTVNETTIYVKTTNSNAKFIYNDNGSVSEYYSDDGAYFEIDLGGGLATRNPNDFTLEFTTINGLSDEFVFEVGIKEKTVDPSAIQVGDNTVEVAEMSYVECTFVAPNNGKYTFTCEEENAWIEYNGKDYKGSEGIITFAFDLKSSEEVTFKIYTLNLAHDYITFNIKLEAVASLGINLVTVGTQSNGIEIEIINYTFTATEAGTYVLEAATELTVIICVTDNISESKYYGEKITYTLKENDTISFKVSREDFQPGSAAFTITKI